MKLDFKIYVFGYNEEAVTSMSSPAEYSESRDDSVTNRVAGMTIKFVLQEHKDAVTAVVCFFKDGVHWMVHQYLTA